MLVASSLCIYRVSARRCLYSGLRTGLANFGVRMITPVSNLPLSTKNYSTSQVVQAGSAGKHWYTERVAAVGLLALIPAGFMYPNPVVDYGLAVLIPLHGHWGYLAVAEDYMPEVLKGAAKGLVYVLTASVFAGLMYLNMKDIGICAAVKAVWSL